MDIQEYLTEKRILLEGAVRRYMPNPAPLLKHHIEAMEYSLNAGGKRVRPILCLAAAETLGHDLGDALAIPCALEFIHTYSLVHDDLPAMDDDELRRGKATNHMVYGEAGAILAGDSLLTFAFELLSTPEEPPSPSPEERLRVIQIISRAAGPEGMVGGQSLDIISENKEIDFETLQAIHRHKTGALITASVQVGAVLGQADETEFAALTTYGEAIGLAFQIVDDLLNVEGTEEELGKAVGSDAERHKATYPGFFGIEGTRAKAREAVDQALDALRVFDHKAAPLRELAQYILSRSN